MDSRLPPPAPKSVLRGHKSQVHAAAFIRRNSRLATADADGFVVLWDPLTMRPAAVWQAHQKPVLAVQSWGERIITHGRDNELAVWKLAEADEPSLSSQPPLDSGALARPRPELDYVMPVNSMNFCAFSSCAKTPGQRMDEAAEIWVSTPNALQLEGIDLFHLPSRVRKHTVKSISNAGMVMATALGHDSDLLTLAAGYENGQCTVARLDRDNATWHLVYNYTAHSQPVLSLQVPVQRDFFITSSADAVLAKHPIPAVSNSNTGNVSVPQTVTAPIRVVNTKHAGQQGLSIRSDGKILATSGWDSRGRVYSCKTLKEVAVLKWHDVSCYTTAFACLEDQQADDVPPDSESEVGVVSVRERRIAQVRQGHWVAMGSKDGRVSLWDVF